MDVVEADVFAERSGIWNSPGGTADDDDTPARLSFTATAAAAAAAEEAEGPAAPVDGNEAGATAADVGIGVLADGSGGDGPDVRLCAAALKYAFRSASFLSPGRMGGPAGGVGLVGGKSPAMPARCPCCCEPKGALAAADTEACAAAVAADDAGWLADAGHGGSCGGSGGVGFSATNDEEGMFVPGGNGGNGNAGGDGFTSSVAGGTGGGGIR